MYFTLQDHPKWQRGCGIRPLSDPLVLALKKNYKASNKGNHKQCCSTCNTVQRCTKSNTVYHTAVQGQDLTDLFKPPPRKQKEDGNSKGTSPKIPLKTQSYPELENKQYTHICGRQQGQFLPIKETENLLKNDKVMQISDLELQATCESTVCSPCSWEQRPSIDKRGHTRP